MKNRPETANGINRKVEWGYAGFRPCHSQENTNGIFADIHLWLFETFEEVTRLTCISHVTSAQSHVTLYWIPLVEDSVTVHAAAAPPKCSHTKVNAKKNVPDSAMAPQLDPKREERTARLYESSCSFGAQGRCSLESSGHGYIFTYRALCNYRCKSIKIHSKTCHIDRNSLLAHFWICLIILGHVNQNVRTLQPHK